MRNAHERQACHREWKLDEQEPDKQLRYTPLLRDDDPHVRIRFVRLSQLLNLSHQHEATPTR